MLKTSARLLALLSLLQQRREWTGRELAAQLDVGPRTVRRDMEKLRELGYPVEASAGAGGGYRFGSGGTLPPLMLDDAEAVAVAIGLRMAASGSIAGIDEISLQASAKLEQLLPERLRHRVRGFAEATSSFALDGAIVDPDVLATLAVACRDRARARFVYRAPAAGDTRRWVEPNAVVHSGQHWYLVAYDLARGDWRTFRIDRVRSRIEVGGRALRRDVPGGDPAAYVEAALRAQLPEEPERGTGRIRVIAAAGEIAARVPLRYAAVAPDGEGACIVTTRGPWSHLFLFHIALLDRPMAILGPPELAAVARTIGSRLIAAA